MNNAHALPNTSVSRNAVPLVDVWFDGAWIRAPSGESRLWGYGFKVVGAGMDHEDYHVSLLDHYLDLASTVLGIPLEEADRAVAPTTIRSIHVADIEGAGNALAHLKIQGFTGHVRMHGDSKSLVERLSAGVPVRADARDAAAISERERMLVQLVGTFASVEWLWVPAAQNAAANGLAWKGVHEVIEHKKMWLKAADTHHAGGGLARLVAEVLLPGDTLDRDIAQMQCQCGRCRPKRAR